MPQMATPCGIVVLTATAEGISRVTAFGDPAWSSRSVSQPSRPWTAPDSRV
jgi:hypothetical protein